MESVNQDIVVKISGISGAPLEQKELEQRMYEQRYCIYLFIYLFIYLLRHTVAIAKRVG